MARLKLATVWFGGCSGCHMSLLDLDEWLFELANLAEIVYSPLVDTKVYPPDVDVVLIEGAIANDEHEAMARLIRKRTRVVVAFGDCAVTGNVTAMRNPLGGRLPVLERSYLDSNNVNPVIPESRGTLPILNDRVVPVHQRIKIDYFLTGCPPNAGKIRTFLEALLHGASPNLEGEQIRFG